MKLHKVLLAMAIPCLIFASESVAVVKSVKGEAVSVTKGAKGTKSLKSGDKIFEKDTIKTVSGASIGLIFEDNTLVSIGSNSEFSIDEYLFEPSKKNGKFQTNLSKGTMACMTGLIAKMNPDAMKIKAKSASMGIRGTYFIVDVGE